MDSSRQHRALVAVATLASGALDFERWVEGLAAALGGAAGIPSWEVVVAHGGDDRPPQKVITAATKSTRAAGGDLSLVTTGELADAIPDDALVLTVVPDAVILSSTVERLVRARRADDRAVTARVVPIDNGDAACVLGRGTAEPCPEAVVAVARVVADPPGPPPVAAPSLLELAVGTAARATAGELLLSVVMRTQVRREEALREVLLCLAAQTDGRFELLIVAHDADADSVESILAEQPRWLRERARVLAATGGTRSRPLNVGFDAAAGTHVAVLDDDDVVSADWVARFLDAAALSPHRLLRAIVGVQQMTASTWPDGVEGHRADPEVTVPYPAVFDLADHLRVNMTPFMAFAFPRATLTQLGGADESLEVCEDWDLILRTAVSLGVVDIPHLTAVYRRWTGHDSYALHDDAVWRRDMQRVRAKLDHSVLLLPPGSASKLAEMSRLRAEPSALAAVYASTSWRVTAPVRAVSALLQRVRRGPAGREDTGD